MDLSDWIDRRADFSPEKTAIGFQGQEISYAELAVRIAKISGTLKEKLGVGRGDRVSVLGYNSPDMIALVFACARLGALFVPLNWRLTPAEHLEILRNCKPKALFAEPSFLPGMAEIARQLGSMGRVVLGPGQGDWLSFEELLAAGAESRGGEPGVDYDSPAAIYYTSGTTGRPKGVVLTQNVFFYNAVNSMDLHAMTKDDRVLTTLPLFHVGGLNVQTLPALHAGASVWLHARFDPAETLAAIEGERITLTVLVPTQMAALLALPRWESADLSSLRLVTTGSTHVPESLVRAVQSRGVPVIPTYGSTETTPVAVYLPLHESERKLGATGKVGLHTELRIVDAEGRDVEAGISGELLIGGPIVMRGYWENPNSTAEALKDGWFRTGDIGHRDGEGFVYIDGRVKDLIISGGENIHPAELENILAECEAISEAAVVGRPDEHWGERVVAVVVPGKPGIINAGEVLQLFEGRVARYKCPRDVFFAEKLPRNAMGKVEKEKVREMVKAMASGSGK